MALIAVTHAVTLDDRDITIRYIHASGPGGQHVNKVATAAQLRYDPAGQRPLPAPVLQKLRAIAGGRMSADATLQITARRYRSQERNRQDALERLVRLLQAAAHRDAPRVPTRPTRTVGILAPHTRTRLICRMIFSLASIVACSQSTTRSAQSPPCRRNRSPRATSASCLRSESSSVG